MGLSQSAISNKLRLLNLDDSVQQALLENKISERHARSLLTLNDKTEQKNFLDRIISERLTVRQLDQEIKKANNKGVSDVPLVDLTPNIEEIKKEATDINNNQPKNIANLMVSEDVMTEYSDNLPNNNVSPVPVENELNAAIKPEVAPTFNNSMDSAVSPSADVPAQAPSATTAPMSFFNNILNGNSTGEPKQEVLNTVPPTPNKFFNPLEEEPVNLNNLDPFSSQPSFNNDSNLISPENEEIEIFDMPTTQAVESAPVAPSTFETLEVKDNVLEEQPVSLNPNNKFFTPVVNNMVDESPVITEVQDTVVNPMDSVGKIEEPADNIAEYTIVDAIMEIRNIVDKINGKGLKVTVDEAGVDKQYHMNILIEKE